jgi:hypothetical protein
MIKYLVILTILLNNSTNAQKIESSVHLSHYVFNQFMEGQVKLKSGETYSQVLNYNILTGEFIFNKDGKYLAIQKPEDVDTVYIDNRKFVPADKKFYEVLSNTPAPLFIEFTYVIKQPGTSTGYGATTTTSAASSYTSLVNSGGAYDLKLPDDFKVVPGYSYLILKDGKYQKANNLKQLYKIFPDKKALIDDLIKKNNTNFSKREDVVTLINGIEQ